MRQPQPGDAPRAAPFSPASGWRAPRCTSTPPAARSSGCSSSLAAIEGEAVTALWLFLVALFIDGTDGMLARHFRVKETIPWFDGALLDNIVDYLTYVFAPIVLLWTDRLPAGRRDSAGSVPALPLLASSYQFCRVDAKTDDHFFLGFPSYWNVSPSTSIVLDLGRPSWRRRCSSSRSWCSCRSATSTRRG